MEKQSKETDVLRIWYWVDNGIIKYRTRGIGKKYDDFYQNWIPKSSYHCIGDDYPWDFFVFKNTADHERLLKDYPEDVYED
jgi:hypothetical protein